MSRLERLAHDALNFGLAALLVLLGIAATGDPGRDWTAVAVSVLAIALKALNPKDTSYGLVSPKVE